MWKEKSCLQMNGLSMNGYLTSQFCPKIRKNREEKEGCIMRIPVENKLTSTENLFVRYHSPQTPVSKAFKLAHACNPPTAICPTPNSRLTPPITTTAQNVYHCNVSLVSLQSPASPFGLSNPLNSRILSPKIGKSSSVV